MILTKSLVVIIILFLSLAAVCYVFMSSFVIYFFCYTLCLAPTQSAKPLASYLCSPFPPFTMKKMKDGCALVVSPLRFVVVALLVRRSLHHHPYHTQLQYVDVPGICLAGLMFSNRHNNTIMSNSFININEITLAIYR